MYDVKKVLERANVQNVRSMLFSGIDLEGNGDKVSPETYKERYRKAEIPMIELLEESIGEKEIERAKDILDDTITNISDLFLEIGIRAGARLLADLLL